MMKNIFVLSGEENIIILGDFNLNPEKEGMYKIHKIYIKNGLLCSYKILTSNWIVFDSCKLVFKWVNSESYSTILWGKKQCKKDLNWKTVKTIKKILSSWASS